MARKRTATERVVTRTYYSKKLGQNVTKIYKYSADEYRTKQTLKEKLAKREERAWNAYHKERAKLESINIGVRRAVTREEFSEGFAIQGCYASYGKALAQSQIRFTIRESLKFANHIIETLGAAKGNVDLPEFGLTTPYNEDGSINNTLLAEQIRAMPGPLVKKLVKYLIDEHYEESGDFEEYTY